MEINGGIEKCRNNLMGLWGLLGYKTIAFMGMISLLLEDYSAHITEAKFNYQKS